VAPLPAPVAQKGLLAGGGGSGGPHMPHRHRAEILAFPLDRNKTRMLLR
jgi:hypothetical protein